MDTDRWLGQGVAAVREWQEEFGAFEPHPSLRVTDEQFGAVFGEFADRLRDNYPFFHPAYAGQMLKPPHPAAVAGYLTAMLINPNNHALDGGPATAADGERGRRPAGRHVRAAPAPGPPDHQRDDRQPGGAVRGPRTAPRARASPTAPRRTTRTAGCAGCSASPGTAVRLDAAGRMDLDALDALLARGEIGTVVATPGTTGLGAIDPVHGVLAVARRHGVRVHVDAAYGGFYALLAGRDGPRAWTRRRGGPSRSCDSVVIDPHKHGLQPYGCGAVLFADPDVGRFYLHDSPYTYFTSGDLHLGEISLECSRAGAAAAALWLTFRLLPPTPDGLGRRWPRAAGPRWTGPRGWTPRCGWTCTSRRTPTSSATSRSPPGTACRPSTPPPARLLPAGWRTGTGPCSSARCGSAPTRSPAATRPSARTPTGRGCCAAC